MEYMAAHLSKIHGLDWHPDNEFVLATSSQDNSVRVRFPGCPEHTTLGSKVKAYPSGEPRGTLGRTSADLSPPCVQFWDYRQPRKYLNILSCQVPVWKARYTVSSGAASLPPAPPLTDLRSAQTPPTVSISFSISADEMHTRGSGWDSDL